jgi:hypothetical protein
MFSKKPQQDALLQAGVQCLYNRIFQGVVCIAGGKKMAWHCNGLHYNASQNIFIATDVGRWQLVGWCFTREFPLKLHREFLFQGFCGHNVRVTLYRGALYQGMTVHQIYFRKHTLSNITVM